MSDASKSKKPAPVALQPVVRRRRVGRIEVLKQIEAELQKEIEWINQRIKPGCERFEAARYAYKKAISIVRDFHVVWHDDARFGAPTDPETTMQTEPITKTDEK